MNELCPIFLKLTGKSCIVVGGGKVATRKARALLDCGAKVKVLSREFCDEVRALKGEIVLEERDFEPADLDGVALAVAATDDQNVNRQVFEEADARGIFVNVVDQPDLCNFYVPSSFSRGDLKIAISTAGKSPALAKRIRKSLEAQFGDEYALFTECMGEVRGELKVKFPDDSAKRMEIADKIINSGILDKVSGLTKEKLLEEMRKWI